mmetsp:Transcript_54286/g.172353  ORF Transcript_54286/g.172353 Transcript_54286/m.172353 type:complete len:232 (-) Transcript_54286:32-727(-)
MRDHSQGWGSDPGQGRRGVTPSLMIANPVRSSAFVRSSACQARRFRWSRRVSAGDGATAGVALGERAPSSESPEWLPSAAPQQRSPQRQQAITALEESLEWMVRQYVQREKSLGAMVAQLGPSNGAVGAARKELEHMSGEIKRLAVEMLEMNATLAVGSLAVGMMCEDLAWNENVLPRYELAIQDEFKGDVLSRPFMSSQGEDEAGEAPPQGLWGTTPLDDLLRSSVDDAM